MDDQTRDHAQRLLSQRDYDELLSLAGQAVLRDPRDWYARYLTGLCLRALDCYEEAAIQYRSAIAVEPCVASIHQALGIVLQLTGRFAEAIGAFKRAIELDDAYPEARNSLGLTYKHMGMPKPALECYFAAIKIVLRHALGNLSTFVSAEQLFSVLVGAETDRSLEEIGERTVSDLKDRLRLDRRYAIFMNNVGGCLLELGRLEDAERTFRQAIAFTPAGVHPADPLRGLEEVRTRVASQTN